ncbi:MAG: hypothetical protein ABH885_03680 [Candidatus Omnitrophota bacterium]
MTRRIITLIALTEVIIGAMTILSLILYPIVCRATKPLNVYLFVMVTSMVSSAIGLGLFDYRDAARRVLVFFSGYVILTKIMIFSGLLQFTGEIMTFVPVCMKDAVSLIYHIFVIMFLSRDDVVSEFKPR